MSLISNDHHQVNDICLVLRNLNVGDGLTNNTRVKRRQIFDKCIVAQRIVHPFEIITIPKIRFLFHLPFSSSFEIIRQQFPLRRAFALTFNKSQGQTLDKVLLDVRGHLFNHGYLYVGMSRVQLYSQVAFYISNNEYDYVHGKCIVGNIVYEDVLKVSERRL